MLYVKKVEDNIVKIANTENDEIVETSVEDFSKTKEELKKQYNEEAIVGMDDERGVHVASVTGIKALAFIDYKDCSPVLVHEDHTTYRESENISRFDTLNYYDSDKSQYLSLGDIAIRACSYKHRINDSFYIKDGYLYVLVDETANHYLYFKYKVLNYSKIERLAVKSDVLSNMY